MKKITANEAAYIYDRILLNAGRKIERGEYEDACSELAYAATWQYNFNTDYSTDSIDLLVSRLRKHYIADYDVTDKQDNSIVMLDSFAWDNRGLTQQYVRALRTLGYRLLFICTDSELNMQQDTRKELADYENSKAIWLDKSQTIQERLEIIRQEVLAFHPSKMFLHFAPWDFLPIMSADACTNVTVYNINLTDHAFWPGVTFIDYEFEFRPFGMTIDAEKRGFKKEQLLNLPYYPIISSGASFNGFPSLPKDAVIILTGGSYYKMFGEHGAFFNILDTLLGISDKVHVLIAGDGDRKIMTSYLNNIKHSQRVHLLGNRHDISEVFKHCDIYLNTYPSGGGLMVQYAAYHEKPILFFSNKNNNSHFIMEVVSPTGHDTNDFYDLRLLREYAEKLVSDVAYRQSEGLKCKLQLQDEKTFTDTLRDYLYKGQSVCNSQWSIDKIAYDSIVKCAIDQEKSCNFPYLNYLCGLYRMQAFVVFPRCIPLVLSFAMFKIARKVYKLFGK